MSLAALLDPTSTARKLALGLGAALVVTLACLACAWGGYRHGHSTAKAEGDAKYAQLSASVADSNRLASDTARKIVDAEVIRRDKLAEDLSSAQATIAAQGRAITNQRIEDASHAVATVDGHCTFGPGWVGLYNEALDLGHGDPAVPGTAPGAGGEAGAVQAAQGGELPGAVTPEDILATHRDNSIVCRNIKAKYLALREWALGLPKTATATEAR